MKNKLVILSLAAVISAGIFSACNSPENKGEASQAYKDSLAQVAIVASDTTSTAASDWEKFKADANDKIQQNEDSIHVIKQRIAKRDANKLLLR